MFFGEFSYMLDAKNRFRIPPKLKEVLENGGFLTKGTNGCLFVLDKQKFEKLAEKFSEVSLFDESSLLNSRMFFSSAFEVSIDGQGRVLLPRNLMEFADIKKDIIFLGVNDHVEIWSKERYEQYSKNYSQIINVKVKKQ